MEVLGDKDFQDEALLRPVGHLGKGFLLTVTILLGVVLWGIYAYSFQVRHGLGVTGLDRPVYWGFYITNFVFFIGISHAGTLISAILRLCQAEWRRSITRAAEVITVVVLFIGAANILLDLGRPDRALFVIFHGNLTSPLLWDVVSISTYLTGSTIYLYLPLIPDIAILRDRKARPQFLYRILSLGFTGTEKEKKRLHIAISIMAVIVIPIAISVHTVVSWVFAMTIQPMWHSTIFGPYFVVGAIFSGIAALILAMAIIRRAYHLQEYLKEIHFNNLGTLLLVMALLWFYFTFAEYLTTFYGGEPDEMAVFFAKVRGPYAPYFWAMVVTNFVIQFSILCNRKTRTVAGTVIASSSVIVGMWLERFTIVVPTLVNPRIPFPRGTYFPSWIEVSLMAASFAMFILLYMGFSKLFPIVSVWEMKEGREVSVAETAERVRTYLPGESEA
ncbi:MAG TPA: NrfD/PsrC family molybdoenzyme membrane anchor subunit [bacterium]|nr:NrfD/PsrC family molybdoenzyme membrane anchor subunit [bacterium]